MKLAFITGISGQDGSYLAELLLKKEYKVFGIIRKTSLLNITRINHIKEKIILKYCDINDYSVLNSYINEIINNNQNFEIFEIYNLGAQTDVKISFNLPIYTTNINAIGVVGLLEIVKTQPKLIRDKIRFYQAGSSELYGDPIESPQNENTPFNPISPYGLSKLYAYHMIKIYRERYDIFAVNGILFNHESPRRGENFITMKIVNGVKKIISEKNTLTNLKNCIEVGNIYSKRDWGHAKDYVNGMWLTLQQNIPEDFVFATGKSYSIKEFIDKCFNYKGIKLKWYDKGMNEKAIDNDGIVRVTINPKYYRNSENKLLVGDASKSIKKLNWKRKYNLDKLIKDMIDN